MNKNYGISVILKKIIAGACILIIGIAILSFNNVIVNASKVNNELIINEKTSKESYLSVFYSDGTMGMIVDETSTNDELSSATLSYENLNKKLVMSSGKPDDQSIVVVFLGEGFTTEEQELFLNKVEEAANYMVTVEPFNYFKDYLTVYAVHCISKESGISGEIDGKFACYDSAGNPATNKCTPNNGTFRCSHGKDTFFNAYYAWRDSAKRVILEMASSDRNKARNIALAASSSTNMVQIIANSAMDGGTAQVAGNNQALGVALTSINTSSEDSSWKSVIMHEFGHSFGGLGDEYWNGIIPSEYPNITKNSDPNTVKWKQWIGYNNVGIYPFSESELDDDSDQTKEIWYRPHQNCLMRYINRPFCSVCQHELIFKLSNIIGLQLFNTTNIEEKYISIDRLNLDVTGKFDIPSVINGRIVSIIGNSAFKECKKITSVTIPSSVKYIDPSAFEGCTNLQSVVLSNELTSIGNSVFKGCTSLSMIDIPSSVKYIDPNAFENCTSLQRVYFFGKLISIGTSAFKGCTSLDSLSIPNSVTNIDSSAFENCTSLESVTLSNSLTSIGASAFKGCRKLTSITIPNCVTNIDSNAFENCTSLESVTLSNSLTSIGNSVFKGCTSLKGITIPNTVTNIDSNAFEGCTSLESIILPNRLYAIGTQTFKDCTRLSSIIFPSSVQYIDDEAFKNCSALSLVTVNREISDITNLGENVFEGTRANLQIVVPTNRIVEYKNKVYWSSYRNKIIPSGQYSELTLNCESNLSNIVNLNQSYNKLYKLNVNCSKAYKFNVTSTIDVNIIVYDINMNVLSNSCNIATPFLSCGTYYISLEFVDPNGAGSFEMLASLRWTSVDIQLLSGINEIKNSMHLNNENVYHCKYYYNNNQGAGFYKISLNTGSNIAYPEGTMKIYSDSSRTTILNRYGTTGINKQAITDSNENEIYLYLPEGRSYIDIVLPLTTYSSISLTIEQVESNNLNYLNTLSSTCLDEIFVNKTLPIYFEEVIISHRSTIQLDIMTNGTITDNIPVYIMSKEKENGYDIGVEIYRLQLKLRNYITKSDRGPVFTTILDPGTYYIGYIGNDNNVSINLVVKRLVNQELNINGTLVADPANDLGFIAGSEVTLNGGSFRGNTITEGFTRHLYLMVENVLEEPMSRLEYDWYSSNENAAKVTAYGTVLALNVNADTDVTIYAVNKDDPSRVYRTTFTIKKETETDPILISCEMSYSYAQENGRYTLELDFSNSPYPMIQYYNWSIDVPSQENNISVSMNYFGVITSSGIGYVVLTGVYTINPRVTITITLTINE